MPSTMTPNDTRMALWSMLGGERAESTVRLEVVTQSRHPGYLQQEVRIVLTGRSIPATLLMPERGHGGALVYCHAHGNRPAIGRTEVILGRPALLAPLGPVLARRGFVVACADMPGFGSRQHEGTESALVKKAQWYGDTVLGTMLRELRAVLTCLTQLPDVHPKRIGAFGLSMGATHAYWLAALDERISAVAHLCSFCRVDALIRSGAHDLHGHYMTVPGLLDWGDMPDVAALIAPRPQLIGSGLQDPLTPEAGLQPALDQLRSIYLQQGSAERLQIITDPDSGHCETPAMREALLAFFDRL